MESTNDLWTLGIAALSGGGLATVVSIFFKYWMERRKMDLDADSILAQKLQKRIDELEAENKINMQVIADLSNQVGYLKAKVELLEMRNA